MHGVYVGTAPESASAALDAIRDELQRVVDDGLPADEVAMGRQQLKGQVTLSLESVSSRMYRAASVELYGEPYRTLDEVLALIDAITVGRCGARRARLLRSRAHDRRESRAQRDRLTARSIRLHRVGHASLARPADRTTRDYTAISSIRHEDRRSERNQDQREPHRARAGGRGGAGRGRPLGAHRDGRRARQRLRRRRIYAPSARQIAPDAATVWRDSDMIMKVKEPIEREWPHMRRGQLDLHLLPLRGRREAHPGAHRQRRHVRRLRDRRAPDPRAAAADADVRGRRPDGGAGGRQVPREALRRPRRAARRRARRRAGQGRDPRRRHRRHQRGEDGGGHGRQGHDPRPVARASALPVRRDAGQLRDDPLEPAQHPRADRDGGSRGRAAC